VNRRCVPSQSQLPLLPGSSRKVIVFLLRARSLIRRPVYIGNFFANRSLPDLLIFFLRAVGMANVSGLVAPKRILGDTRSMIADPLKGASNEDQIEVTRYQLRVPGTSLNELVIDITG
jgi:hypothetical protein